MYFKVTEIDWGTASRIGKRIYINKNLKRFPGLYSAILNHEKKHTSGWKLADLRLDLHDPDLSLHKKDYYKFMFKNPRAFFQFSPIARYEGKWILDPSLLLIEGALLVLFGVILVVLT